MKKKLTIFLLLTFLLSACSIPKITDVPLETDFIRVKAQASEEKDSEPILRTEEIFKEHEGKLVIIFLYLEFEAKSGDAIFIKSPDGKTMLIDAGIVLTGDQAVEYLDKLGVEKLDYAVATHPHHDHIGGFGSVFRSKEIGTLLTTDIPHTTVTYQEFVKLIDEYEIPVEYLQEGDSFMLGEEVKIDVLNPPRNAQLKENMSTADFNNLSLVLKLTYKKRTFLFTADIYKKQEYDIAKKYKNKLKVDVMQIPHHGINTSSAIAFLKQTRPKYTVMTANVIQSKSVYNRNRRYSSKLFVTALDQNILMLSDGETIQVITEKDRQMDLRYSRYK